MRLTLALGMILAGCSGGGDKVDASSTTETNCFDGIDNNGDGLIDCADPMCASVAACVAEIPAGWSGYVALFDGAPTMVPSGCPSGFTFPSMAGNHDLTSPDAICAPCTCSAPSGNLCTATAGAVTLPPTSWAKAGQSCAAITPTNGCTGTSACEPRATAPFGTGLCVHQTGEQTCPAGFGDRHVFYSQVVDNRGCTACLCGNASAGACPVSGGAPMGMAMPGMPTTYCCAM